MRKITFFLLFLLILYARQSAHANSTHLYPPPCIRSHANAIFLPVVHNYLPQQYKGGNQNWSISQSDEGIIYIANNDGLLSFDGIDWDITYMPDHRIIRSVKAIGPRIYIGSYEEFGYFEKDQYGHLRYTSLIPLLKNHTLNNDEIWTIEQLDSIIYFHSFNAIFRYDGKSSITSYCPQEMITVFGKIGNCLYGNYLHSGLVYLDSKTLKPIRQQSSLKDITALLPFHSDTLYITYNNGLHLENNSKPYEEAIGKINKTLKNKEINRAILTSDSIYILGTVSDGILLLDHNLQLLCEIREGVLPNNTILGLYSDKNNNTWLALDKGISVFHYNPHFQKTAPFKPNVGTIYSAYMDRSHLMLATNQGLYSGVIGKNPFQMEKRIAGQTWGFWQYDNTVFCSAKSTYLLTAKGLKEIYKNHGGDGVCLSHGYINNQEVLLQGTYSTLNLFRKNDKGDWTFSHTIENFYNPIRHIAIDYKGRIWCSHFRNGLYCVKLKDDLQTMESCTFFSSPNSQSVYFAAYEFEKQIIFLDQQSIYLYNEDNRQMEPFDRLNKVLGTFSKAYRVVHNGKGHYWFITPTHAVLLSAHNEEFQLLDVVDYNTFSESYINNELNITPLSDDSCLFCFENSLGLYIYHPEKNITNENVSLQCDTWTAYTDNKNDTMPLLLNQHNHIPYAYKEVEIHFSYPIFHFNNNIQYRYSLDNGKWQNIGHHQTIDLHHPSIGHHQLSIQAVNATEDVLSETRLTFTVKAPFFLSTWAIVIYVFAFLFLLTLLITSVWHIMERKRRKLEQEKEKEQKEKQIEQDRIIYKLKADHLENELKYKSKELASSTISIIRKNEILTQIKEEITTQKEALGTHYPSKYYNKLIKLIDENISNEDDWNIFQSNFDRIHENFFRHLKERYPDLSSADLRLCAWLRLNLTTKEIANLANISVKGVEVARYRLRKKLDLPKEKNLNEFMIEFK